MALTLKARLQRRNQRATTSNNRRTEKLSTRPKSVDHHSSRRANGNGHIRRFGPPKHALHQPLPPQIRKTRPLSRLAELDVVMLGVAFHHFDAAVVGNRQVPAHAAIEQNLSMQGEHRCQTIGERRHRYARETNLAVRVFANDSPVRQIPRFAQRARCAIDRDPHVAARLDMRVRIAP